MENQTLVFVQQHDKDNRSYIVEVYKGMALRKARFDHKGITHEKVVEIKAFRIVVKEVVTVGHHQDIQEKDFGFCTSRTNEFMYIARCIKEQCNDIRDIEFLMADMDENLRIALDRDAIKAIKRQLGLFKNPAITVTSSTNMFNKLSQK